jgi:hypothetical protein
MKNVLLGCVVATAIFGTSLAGCSSEPAGSTDDDTQDLTEGGGAAIFGTWTSTTCEVVDAATYQLRTYHFSSKGVSATWDRYADASCSPASKLMTIAMSGSAKVTGLSAKVFGAANITVFIDHKSITPTKLGLAVVKSACSELTWANDTELDVTDTGCNGIVPAHDICPAEYDLVKLKHMTLYFGDRAHTLCTPETRPTTLSQWGIGVKY